MLIMEWREERKPFGWTAQRCPKCERLEAFAGFDRVEVIRVWFIPMGARLIGRMAVCDFCSSGFELPQDADLGAFREWKRGDGLAPLLGNGGASAQAPAREAPSQVALEALLRTLDARSRTGDQVVTRGLWTGGATGLLIGVVSGYLLTLAGVTVGPWPLDGQFISLGGLGAIAGAILGAINEGFRQRTLAVEEVLGGAVRKHRVRPHALRAVAERMQPPVPRAIRAMGAYRGGRG